MLYICCEMWSFFSWHRNKNAMLTESGHAGMADCFPNAHIFVRYWKSFSLLVLSTFQDSVCEKCSTQPEVDSALGLPRLSHWFFLTPTWLWKVQSTWQNLDAHFGCKLFISRVIWIILCKTELKPPSNSINLSMGKDLSEAFSVFTQCARNSIFCRWLLSWKAE